MIITNVLSVLVLVSCSPGGLPAKENMLKNKSFVHLYFQTEKECMDAQPEPDFFQNCHQQVEFFKNNRVEIMLSDIYYQGTYSIQGNNVVLLIESNVEIPDGVIIFEIINPTRLKYIENGSVWKKMSGNSIWN